MKANLNMNAVNQVDKGSLIYERDETLHSICVILKGRVLVQAEGVRMVLGSGNFLGIYDISSRTCSFTYTAYDLSVLYVFSVETENDVRKILENKPEYRGLLNTSTNYFIAEMKTLYDNLQGEFKSLKEFILAQYEFYQKTGAKNGIVIESISSVEVLSEMTTEDILSCKDIDYYLSCSKIPVEAQKNYYMGSAYVSERHFSEQKQCISELLAACRRVEEQLRRCFGILISNEKNLFLLYSRLALDMGHVGVDNKKALLAIDELIEKINSTELFLIEKAGRDVKLNRAHMEETYFALISGENYEEKVQVTEKKELTGLDDSLGQILDYAPIDLAVKESFEMAVKNFCRLSDKNSHIDEAVQIRKEVAKYYYKIYEAVALKSFEEENLPMVISLFLNFGYVSEILFSKDMLEKFLLFREREKMGSGSRIYSLYQWLKAIYDGEQDPSKNEFDMDYTESLRQDLRAGVIDQGEMNFRLSNPKERVHFEVENLFRYVNRIAHGKITMFIPILFEEGFFTKIDNAYITADKCNRVLNKIQKADYSVFYRERRVAYEEVKINNETVLEKCMPDIILLPIYGKNGVMWQEIVGKKRNTSGRFLLPILLETDLEKEMMKVVGKFRWEMCKTDEGMHWNDIHYPSLTSEYTDYLQFYRKNPDLSKDTKAKIKAQLTQYGNRHPEVFAKDYAEWITREVKGVMRLNQVVRKNFYTYIPFPKEIREKLEEQVMYQDAGKRFRVQYDKRKRNLENCCKKFEKAGLDIPKELGDTRDYYNIY